MILVVGVIHPSRGTKWLLVKSDHSIATKTTYSEPSSSGSMNSGTTGSSSGGRTAAWVVDPAGMGIYIGGLGV